MASFNQKPDSFEWYVSLPFSDLEKLIHEKDYIDALQHDNEQLRREISGLRSMFTELLDKFSELRRELNGR